MYRCICLTVKCKVYLHVSRRFCFRCQRFCPSVLIYLTMTVPAIWFLELHELEKRIDHRLTNFNLSNISLVEIHNETYDLSAHLGNVLGVSRFPCTFWINVTDKKGPREQTQRIDFMYENYLNYERVDCSLIICAGLEICY